MAHYCRALLADRAQSELREVATLRPLTHGCSITPVSPRCRDNLDIEQSARQLREHAGELDRQRSDLQHQAEESRKLTDAVRDTK